MISAAEKVIESEQSHRELTGRAKANFESLGTTAFIRMVRQPEEAENGFDMEATAEAYRCHVIFMDTKAAGYAMPSTRQILISCNQSQYEQYLTLGHEMAHIFLYDHSPKEWQAGMTKEEYEDFCEYFAHQLVDLPAQVNMDQLVLFKDISKARASYD